MNPRVWSTLFRFVLALWVGGVAAVTFVVTPPIFDSFPRDEAGRVVGVVFPVYFPYVTALVAAALVLYLLARRGPWGTPHRVAVGLLVTALLAAGANQFWVHPRARAVKAEIHSFENLAPDHPLRRRFGRLHGVSMALNLLVLAEGAFLLLGDRRWLEG